MIVSTIVFTYVNATPGKYSITLTVTDASGNKFSATKTQFVVAFKSPTADFSGSDV